MNITHFLHQVDQVGELLRINVPQIVELEQLRTLSPNSFGYQVAAFFDRHQLIPFTTGPRRKQLHDSVHVLTGYGTDPIGEAEVQAFLLGAKFHLAQVILGLGLLRIIYKHSSPHPALVWNRLLKAYWRGQASQFDIDAWHPETQWQWEIEQVRSRAGI
jgi:ubiquinone biosynthesis protein COQ4